MQTIPEIVITAVWDRQCDLNDTDAQELMERFVREQPTLTAYLVAAEEGLESDVETDMIPLGVLVWETMASQGYPLPSITETWLEQAEERNIQFLQDLDGGSEIGGVDATQKLFDGFNQKPLLQFVLEILMAGNEETPEMAPEHIGLQLIHLKTVIDCLDQ